MSHFKMSCCNVEFKKRLCCTVNLRVYIHVVFPPKNLYHVAVFSYFFLNSGKILDLNIRSSLEGDNLVVTTPLHNSTQDECMTFEFYDFRLYLDNVAKLSVYALYRNDDRELLWTNGAMKCCGTYFGWTKEEVRLPAGEFKVIFEATVGLKHSSDMAIDNVNVMDIRDCKSIKGLDKRNGKFSIIILLLLLLLLLLLQARTVLKYNALL